MARSCGLRIGPRRFELVVLDGSPKKHRITAFQAGEFPRDADDPVGAAVSALKEAAKSASIPADNVRLVVDGGLAAFRTIKLPFDDDAKIESVLKFEIEGQLPQWTIDDVLVDWVKLESLEKETNLLVTAVPKGDVEAVLTLCEQASIEPLEAELETTAMINAALSADVCHIDDAQVLVHIGETSTSVVVMDSGQVRSMRAIHVGALSWELERGAAEASAEEDEASDEPAEEVPGPDADVVRRHLQQIVTRLRRELGRTLSGARTINEIDAIYVCGTELPELVGSTVMDVPVYVLDVFEEDSGQPAEGTAPLVVAYGAALTALGGGHVQGRLRREELRYAGRLEKLELPLAIAALLLVTWLSVFNIFEKHQFDLRTKEVDAWLMSTLNYMEGDPAQGHRGRLEYMNKLTEIQDMVDEIRSEHRPDDQGDPVEPSMSPMDRLLDLEAALREEVQRTRIDAGTAHEVTQPLSALHGLTLVMGLLDDLSPDRIGRVSIRQVESVYQRKSSQRPDMIEVTLDLTFFADSYPQAVANLDTFQGALRERGWEYDDVKTAPLEEGEGAYIDRLKIRLDPSQFEQGEA